MVAGGDGSIHEAVNGIMRAESDTALGVIPLGTDNDFAKACSIPLRWQDTFGQCGTLATAKVVPHWPNVPYDRRRSTTQHQPQP